MNKRGEIGPVKSFTENVNGSANFGDCAVTHSDCAVAKNGVACHNRSYVNFVSGYSHEARRHLPSEHFFCYLRQISGVANMNSERRIYDISTHSQRLFVTFSDGDFRPCCGGDRDPQEVMKGCNWEQPIPRGKGITTGAAGQHPQARGSETRTARTPYNARRQHDRGNPLAE